MAGHAHSHDHHAHAHGARQFGRAFAVGAALNTAFVAINHATLQIELGDAAACVLEPDQVV